ncbi:Hypothetical protein MYEA_2340 [Mycoplasma yeatsii 13926]|uniref:Ribosome maturation factor RimP n=1 Tax=Mycoplasma yeatsii 13926 TaxID=1188240 RepID=S6G3N3_9MOLU|nr:ribosome maturation factor RimP [Mycoplasma yeatsii]EOA07366.1 Hypothetical protein MYEA_2340 [Mycoplasma yeatsii 13926]
MKKFSVVKSKIQEIVNKELEKLNLEVYQINNHREFDGDVLQILVQDISKSNKGLDFDTIVKANEVVSDALDQLNEIDEPYLLEVASAGIEKEIRTCQELEKAINEYLFVQLNSQQKNVLEFSGHLVKYDSDSNKFGFEFFVKGQKKKIELSWEDIKFVRYAIKF